MYIIFVYIIFGQRRSKSILVEVLCLGEFLNMRMSIFEIGLPREVFDVVNDDVNDA